ncbi:MAG TPA: beta-N-acetylhexosaminidase [Virgibacillus sp.]|nr:beta-N-acetylhexosaminidase [Virgibacillus sp.]
MRQLIVMTIIILVIAAGVLLYYKGTVSEGQDTHHADNQANHPKQENVKKDNQATGDDNTSGDGNRDEEGELEKMNLDEKIGQLIFSGVEGTEMTADTEKMIQNAHVGGVILFGDNIESGSQTVEFLNDIKKANTANPSPLLLGVDEEGGSVTRMPDDVRSLPKNQAIGKLDDADLSHQVGTLLGKQMSTLGFNLDFAPVMDVNSNPDNPFIGDRSFGDDPDMVSDLGIQTMKGIQEQGIISVIKHFPGHGDTGTDSHLELPEIDKSYDDLNRLELIPFQNGIKNGADVTMIAHILLPQIDPDHPASISEEVITNMLRDDLSFDGVVITDDLTMQAITDHVDIGDAALKSVQAGSDLLLVAHEYDNVETVFDRLKEAVQDGDLSEERIDESVKRIQALKKKYDIADDETGSPDLEKINEEIDAISKKVQ